MLGLLRVSLLAATASALCANSCSNHGRCNTYDQCVCQEGYYGADCSLRYCKTGVAWGDVPTGTDSAHALAECSHRGHCDREKGTCSCDAAFEGDACERLACPEGCSASGTCETVDRYASLNGLAYAALWDSGKIQGCVCDDTHHNYQCSYVTCPHGDDPLTTGQADEIQQVDCEASLYDQQFSLRGDANVTGGSFVLRYGPEVTTPLSFDAAASGSAAAVQESLEALSGVDSVTVAREGDNYPEGSDEGGLAFQWSVTFDSGSDQYSLTPLFRVDEVQRIVCAATGGSFYLTFDGASVSVPYDSTDAEFEALMEGLESVTDVEVAFSDSQACTSAGNEILVTFVDVVTKGEDDGGDLPAIVADKDNNDAASNTGLTHSTLSVGLYGSFSEVTKGEDTCRTSEVQTMYCRATGGSFTLTYDGSETTASLSYGATTTTLASALEALASVDSVEVSVDQGSAVCSSAGTYFSVTFLHVNSGDVDGDVPALTGTHSLTHATSVSLSSTASEDVAGLRCTALSGGYSGADYATMSRASLPEEPTFMLGFRGVTTSAISASATASEVEALLEDLKTIHGVDVSFSGDQMCQSPLNSLLVTFTNDFGQLPEMVADASRISSELTVEVLSKGEKGSSSVNGTKEDAPCSNRGWCDEGGSGVCTCYSGFDTSDGRGGAGTRGDCGHVSGDDIVACPGVIECSGHGVCSDDPEYACTCATDWTGGDCSERLCPTGRSWFDLPNEDDWAHRELTECSDRGTCDRTSGECTCQTGFSGGACQYLDCPQTVENGVCNAHGICAHMSGLAQEAQFRGSPTEFTYGDPMTAATWDRTMVRGCFCDEGYEGHACHLRVCPHGDDPMTDGQVYEEQVLQCVGDGGSFVLSFRYAASAAIAYDATAAEVEAALEAMATISDVNVTFSSGAAACTLDGSNVISVVFITEFGPLPGLQPDIALLEDSTQNGGLGGAGDGVVSVAIDGESLGGVASVTGTREYLPCSGRGLCDQARGTCDCFDGWAGSDGFGNRGDRGDCGARISHLLPPSDDDSGSGGEADDDDGAEEVRIPTTV